MPHVIQLVLKLYAARTLWSPAHHRSTEGAPPIFVVLMIFIWLMDIELPVEIFYSAGLLFHGRNIFVTMSGAATYETTIEIESHYTQIIWIVYGERAKNIFLSTPDWVITFFFNRPPIIFNKTYRIRYECCSDFIIIITPTWIHITSNCRFCW